MQLLRYEDQELLSVSEDDPENWAVNSASIDVEDLLESDGHGWRSVARESGQGGSKLQGPDQEEQAGVREGEVLPGCNVQGTTLQRQGEA